MARLETPLLASPSAARRRRLHSLSFAVHSRIFSVLLFIAACQLSWYEAEPAVQSGDWQSLAKLLFVVLAIVALAGYLWRRPKRIFATVDGLQVGDGKKRRLIPWSRVLDIREMPSVRMQPFLNPRMWQVDLDKDERFDFCGTRNARQIVAEFIERAERPPH
jgi:membrane protein YdbS with pleckstrin-like domain